MAKSEEESTLDTIRDLKRKEPFVPFSIVMSSGDRYLIDDPDALALASTQLHYYPRSGLGIHMRLSQITAVEELNERPAA
ncbi:MAG TPA: hypothetical protein VF669_21865 [Tepidisphaeraceae bacterium]|jgi:hypothetical protein